MIEHLEIKKLPLPAPFLLLFLLLFYHQKQQIQSSGMAEVVERRENSPHRKNTSKEHKFQRHFNQQQVS